MVERGAPHAETSCKDIDSEWPEGNVVEDLISVEEVRRGVILLPRQIVRPLAQCVKLRSLSVNRLLQRRFELVQLLV